MPWTTIAKPSAGTYTRVNPEGKQIYDQSDLDYDSTAFYDSLSTTLYTNVSKPVAGLQIFAGTATGLLGPFTYGTMRGADLWTRIGKP